MKKLINTSVLILCFGFLHLLNAQGLVSHDFNDGDMGPFVDCTTKSPNYARVVNNRLRTYWKESSYRSSDRVTKGAEACGDPVHNGVGYLTYKYCWMGFTINIDENYMEGDKGVGGLAQIFGFDHANGKSSWTAMLDIEDGDLSWVDRRGQGNSRADVVVFKDFPKGVDVDIIIHAVLSDNNKGLVELFVNGNLEYSAYNIDIGMGEFDNNDTQTNESSTEFKIGQYNHSSAKEDEIRIVDYDNISWYDGKDGYDVVNPNKNQTPIEPTPPVQEGTIVHITKRNATGYAIDGGSGGSNGQDVTLSAANPSDEGQLWFEIDRGNGFYSYEKYGTSYSLDGGNDGATRQIVYLWQTSATNQNQHWEKEAVGGGAFKLIKRNAAGFAVNGGSGGAEGRNINMWSSASTNQNLQWIIIPINTAEEVRLEAEDYDSMSGIQTEASTESGENVGYINDGDWLRFDNVNLSGITNLDARVATRTAGGTLEVRTGSANGTLIGTINVGNTGGYQDWETLNTSISNASGTQDVYIVFKGGSGYLFNINWIEFNSSSRSNKDIDEVLESASGVKLYPNPIVSSTTIKNAANSTITIYAMDSSVLFTQTISSDSETIDLSGLASGIYFAEIKGATSLEVIKLVKN